MIPGQPGERRRSPRYLCSHIVAVSFGQREQTEEALLEDLCAEGAGLALETPILAGDEVEVAVGNLWVGARVLYCSPRQNGFRLGLEFAGEWRWRPESWRPDHLFLPSPSPPGQT